VADQLDLPLDPPSPEERARRIFEKIRSRPGASDGLAPNAEYLFDRVLLDDTVPIETRNALAGMLGDEFGQGLDPNMDMPEPPRYRATQRALAMDPNIVGTEEWNRAMQKADDIMSRAGAMYELGAKKQQQAYKMDPSLSSPGARRLYEEGGQLMDRGVTASHRARGQTSGSPDSVKRSRQMSLYEAPNMEKRRNLENEIYEQERRLSDLNPDSRSGREAKARVSRARAALRGLGRLAAVATGVGTLMEGAAYAQDVAEEGPVGGTRKYVGEGIEGTGALASGIESLTERETLEEMMGYPTSPTTRAMRFGGDVAGAFGRGMGAVGRAIRGSDEEEKPIRETSAEKMRREVAARTMERERARKE